MTAPATEAEERSYQLTPTTIALLGVAALAWAGVVAVAREMGNGSGTMGLPLREFLPMWSLMMTAMMLPAVAPVAESSSVSTFEMWLFSTAAVWFDQLSLIDDAP